MRIQVYATTLLVACLAFSASGSFAADAAGEPGRSSGKPNPLKNVYFGEQHLHTQDSTDAFAMGSTSCQRPVPWLGSLITGR